MNRRGFFQRVLGAAAAVAVAPKVLTAADFERVVTPVPHAADFTTTEYGLSYEWDDVLVDEDAWYLMPRRGNKKQRTAQRHIRRKGRR